MFKPLARISLAATTIAAALSLAIPAALAAGTWTVTGGPSFFGTPQPGTTFTFTDSTSGLSISCTKATFTGTVVDESGSTNTSVGSLTSFGFSSCTGPLGSTASATDTMTATIIVISYNPSTNTVTGAITNVDLIFTIKSLLGTCTAAIKGTAAFTYNVGTSQFRFITAGDAMRVASTSGSCAGIVATNDVITLGSGSFGLILTGSPVNPIVIEQP